MTLKDNCSKNNSIELPHFLCYLFSKRRKRKRKQPRKMTPPIDGGDGSGNIADYAVVNSNDKRPIVKLAKRKRVLLPLPEGDEIETNESPKDQSIEEQQRVELSPAPSMECTSSGMQLASSLRESNRSSSPGVF